MHKSPRLACLPAAAALACLLTAPLAGQEPSPLRVIPYPIDLPANFATAIANGTRTANGRPGPKHWTNHAHYAIEAEVDPAAHRLTGRAVMTYHNRSPKPLTQLVVHCYQDLMKAGAPRTRTVVATNGFELLGARLDGEAITVAARDTKCTIRLPAPLAAGAKTKLEIDWAFDVPKAGTAPRMGYEKEDVLFLGYWYPQFAVCDDVDGWVADPHRGNGEFYMDYADYDLAITVPQGYVVRATGELTNADEVLTQKSRDALQKAMTTRDVVHVVDKDDLAAGKATAESASGKLVWRFRAENVRDAAVGIGRTYLWDATHAVIADKNGPGKDGTAMIHAVYEANAGDWVRAAEYTRHTIEYMSAHVHPYMWPHMTACEGVIGGGMEYPMMTICGGRQPASVIAHETIHMWFPMLVGSNEKRYAWQDEGFTSFWTTLCRGDFTGGKSGAQGTILGYVNTVTHGGDAVCMRHADAFGEDNFQFAAYGKPAAVLHQLRAMLGDVTFAKAFRRYASDWAFKHPTPYDFFATCSDVAGVDLDPYFRTWMFETWQLDHAVKDVAVDAGKTVVLIEDRGRAMHYAEVEVTYRDGGTARQTVPASLWQQTRVAKLVFGADVVKVTIDPDSESLDVDRRNNVWEAQQ